MRLNVEEMIFIAVFDTSTRETAVQGIAEALPQIEDRELEHIAEQLLLKLDRMSDEEFAAIDFSFYGEEGRHD